MNGNQKNNYQKIVEDLFGRAGITINGTRPFDIQVKNENFYKRFLRDTEMGFEESYVDGWWECEALDELTARLFRANLQERQIINLKLIFYALKAKLSPTGKKKNAFLIGRKMYDLGNELFQGMLGKRIVYTCGYWRNANSLDQAQENKLDLICKKLGLKPGMKVLDIGCGWGGFASYAAEKYGVEVVGITVSKEQVKLGQKICAGLPVKLKLLDYRDLDGEYDRIVEIEMMEHVCPRYYRTFMQIVHRCLKDDGLFLIEAIGRNQTAKPRDFRWARENVWPNSEIPSVKQIAQAIEGLFVMEDWHNFGSDSDETHMEWYRNFAKNWDQIKGNFDERFFRTWRLILLGFAGAFRARYFQIWHIVLSKKGVPGGYHKNFDYVFPPF